MVLGSCLGIVAATWPRVVSALLLCVLVALVAPARADVPVPPLAARVTDLTNTLSTAERAALEEKLAAFEARKGSQIAVLVVATTEQEAIEQYARRVLDQWKLGRKGIDDGALLLVAKDDRRLRIETQYGLEGVLPDAVAKRIVSEVIVPRFREQDFNGGISAGIDRMIAVVDGEALPPPAARPARQTTHDDNRVESLMMLGFVMLFFVGSFLRATLGRFGGAGVTAGVGGVIAWVIAGSLVAALAVGVILLVLSLVIGVAGLAGLGRGSGRGGHWGGGWSGGGSWGGGSTGGDDWSGGGGSGGGGGASGSW